MMAKFFHIVRANIAFWAQHKKQRGTIFQIYVLLGFQNQANNLSLPFDLNTKKCFEKTKEFELIVVQKSWSNQQVFSFARQKCYVMICDRKGYANYQPFIYQISLWRGWFTSMDLLFSCRCSLFWYLLISLSINTCSPFKYFGLLLDTGWLIAMDTMMSSSILLYFWVLLGTFEYSDYFWILCRTRWLLAMDTLNQSCYITPIYVYDKRTVKYVL